MIKINIKDSVLSAKQDKLTVNPEVTTTDPDLTSLTIDGTKYKIVSEAEGDYEALNHKPKLNNIEINGSQTSATFGLQNSTDDNLTTTDKTIVGAINELNSKPTPTENHLYIHHIQITYEFNPYVFIYIWFDIFTNSDESLANIDKIVQLKKLQNGFHPMGYLYQWNYMEQTRQYLVCGYAHIENDQLIFTYAAKYDAGENFIDKNLSTTTIYSINDNREQIF